MSLNTPKLSYNHPMHRLGGKKQQFYLFIHENTFFLTKNKPFYTVILTRKIGIYYYYFFFR